MLQCATCSNVTVWTQVCMAPMTVPTSGCEAGRPIKGHKASQGTTSHSSAAATARNSINQYVTEIHSQVQGEGQGTAAEFWQQKITTNCHSAIPLIAQDMISAAASQAHDAVPTSGRTPVFSLWFANCRQTQQDGQITEHASLAQSELR